LETLSTTLTSATAVMKLVSDRQRDSTTGLWIGGAPGPA